MVLAISGDSQFASLNVAAAQESSGPRNNSGAVSSSSKIRTLEDLKNLDEKLYKDILSGLAMQACQQATRAEARRKRISKESQNCC